MSESHETGSRLNSYKKVMREQSICLQNWDLNCYKNSHDHPIFVWIPQTLSESQ